MLTCKREVPRADAPPRDEVAARSVDHCSFMTMRRNQWKSFAFFMALVNMSAMLSGEAAPSAGWSPTGIEHGGAEGWLRHESVTL